MLQNKVLYVTGGTSGIGLSIVEIALANGMNVAYTSRSTDHIDATQKLLKSKYPEVKSLGILSDVTDPSSEEAAIEVCLQNFKQLDVVVANAGIGIFKAIDKMSFDEWDEVIQTNLYGPFNTLQASVEALKMSKGYYITIASLAGTNFFARGSAYNASKFGLVGFTQAAMLDLRVHDIKVSTIMPGSVMTHFNGHEPSADDAWKIHPNDIAQILIDLLRMPARTLPSKVEVRPSKPPSK